MGYGVRIRRVPGSTRASKWRVRASISPSTCAGTSSERSISTSRARAVCTFRRFERVPRNAAGMSRSTSARFTSSDQITSKRPSSSTAPGASRNIEPYVVPRATATSMVLASTTSPSMTSLASWHRKSLSNRPTDHRYRPVPRDKQAPWRHLPRPRHRSRYRGRC